MSPSHSKGSSQNFARGFLSSFMRPKKNSDEDSELLSSRLANLGVDTTFLRNAYHDNIPASAKSFASNFKKGFSKSSRVGSDSPNSQNHHSARETTNKDTTTSSQASLAAPASVTDADNSSMAVSSLGGNDDMAPKHSFLGKECVFCFERMEMVLDKEHLITLACDHYLHGACLSECLKQDIFNCSKCGRNLAVNKAKSTCWIDIDAKRKARQPDAPSRKESSASMSQAIGQLPTPSYRNGHRNTLQNINTTRSYGNQSLTSGNRDHDSAASSIAGGNNRILDSRSVISADIERRDSISYNTTQVANPINPPNLTLRSEFPTITRSRQLQLFTTLITVEVPTSGWTLDQRDLLRIASVPENDESQSPVSPNRGRSLSVSTHHSTASDLSHALSAPSKPLPSTYPKIPPMSIESQNNLDTIETELKSRDMNWHNLDFQRFGKLRLYGTIGVSKERKIWQVLGCYLFEEILICIREQRPAGSGASPYSDGDPARPLRYKLKGSILMKKHLKNIVSWKDEPVLHLHLSAPEVPSFFLLFNNRVDAKIWKDALRHPNAPIRPADYYSIDDSHDTSSLARFNKMTPESNNGLVSPATRSAPATTPRRGHHVPLDIVLVISMYRNMDGYKLRVLKSALRFVLSYLGPYDRLAIVTFGAPTGCAVHTGLTYGSSSRQPGVAKKWEEALFSLRPSPQDNLRGDMIEATNLALDILTQRSGKRNPLSSILIISDSNITESESPDLAITRAESMKIPIHSLGYGLSHRPDTLTEMSRQTKGSYMFVKDWMMLRECLAGVIGSLQSISHQDARVKLRLPEDTPARLTKVTGTTGAVQLTSGREAEAPLGDLRFGDKRDILVQLHILPSEDQSNNEAQDAWESLRTGLEALGGIAEEPEKGMHAAEEMPILQCNISFNDILRDGQICQPPRPSLLAVTMLTKSSDPAGNYGSGAERSIPPHPAIVQRRMELLVSDMLTRALSLISSGKNENAKRLLEETKSTLRGLGKGNLPNNNNNHRPSSSSQKVASGNVHPNTSASLGSATNYDAMTAQTMENYARNGAPGGANGIGYGMAPHRQRMPMYSSANGAPSPLPGTTMQLSINPTILNALLVDIDMALEWIAYPEIFNNDSRKATLQSIDVISTQRAFTARSPMEKSWAERVGGICSMLNKAAQSHVSGEDDAYQ